MLHLWMLPGRALNLANSGAMGVNPDQRMHDDAEKLCTLTADLGTGLLQATILFATFAGVLWSMSARLQRAHRLAWSTRFRATCSGPRCSIPILGSAAELLGGP